MSSRMLHLAVTEKLLAALPFSDPARLRIGSVLPDAELPVGFPPAKTAHFPLRLPGNRKTLDLTSFRERFSDRLLADDLVLGYYLHLAADVIHRDFFYKRTDWAPADAAAVRLLHRDYSLLNPWLVRAYGIRKEDAVPTAAVLDALASDPVLSGFSFDLKGFFSAMEGDFDETVPLPLPEDFTVFTEALAAEWIECAAGLLVRETASLRSTGLSVLDERAMAWLKYTG